MTRRLSVADYPQLVAQWHPTKNGDLKPQDVPAGSGRKVWWKCFEGKWSGGARADVHEWEAIVGNRTKHGRGCPCCSGHKTVPSNCLASAYPELAKQWHPTKNSNITPFNVTIRCGKKFWWKCCEGKLPDGSPADDHEWMASVAHRTLGTRCPCCSGQMVVASNCLAATHPELAKQWHPTKNGDLSPFNVTSGCNKNVWWKCSEGKWPGGATADDHEWRVRINTRTNMESGCSCCAGRTAVPSNCLATTHPDLAKQWHPTKNGDVTPHNVTAGNNERFWWKCSEGKWPDGSPADDHEWEAAVNNRTNPGFSCNCPCCSGRKAVPSNCLATTSPQLAKQWHPTKNGQLTASDVTRGSGKKVWWKCDDCGQPWPAVVSSRMKNGCPRCRKIKGEQAISDYLLRHKIKHRHQWGEKKHGLGRQKFDFAVNRLGELCLIEYHGRQHYLPCDFGSKKDKAGIRMLFDVLRRDRLKERWCKEHKKKLLVIPYWDFDRIEVLLDEFFTGHEPTISEPPEIVKKYEPMRQRILDRLSRATVPVSPNLDRPEP